MAVPLFALAFASACESPADPQPEPVPYLGSLKIEPDSVHFAALQTQATLRAVVRNAAGQAVAARVAWSYSGDPGASVGLDGSVYAQGNGRGKVVASATLPDGTPVADTVPVVVRQAVAGVAIIPRRLGLFPGDTMRLTAVAYDSLRWPVRDVTFTWRSSEPSVVSVSASGTATGRALGVASVTATASTPGGSTSTSGSAEIGVASGGNYTQVRSGGSHTCGLARSGDVYCWGNAGGEMLSDGTRLSGDVPAQVRGAEKFVSIDAGYFHTCGLTAAGGAFCWGGNLFGQLGTGDATDRDTPQPVGGGMAFTRIAAGATHTCGLVPAGDAYCWGSNDYGEIGSGTPIAGATSKQPTPVGGGLKFVEITAGDRHSCGLTREGAAYCWGSNSGYKLGTSEALFYGSTAPIRLGEGLVLSSIVAVGNHTCAMTPQSQVYCWGGWADINGGDVKSRSAPTRVGPGIDFASLADGNDAMCAVARDGAAYCWTASDATPLVRVGGSVSFASLSPGRDRTCGVGTDTKIYCWGPGGVGGMGDGRTRGSDVPVPVSAAF